MGKKLYVGNLPYSVRDGDLEQAFGQFGAVTSAKVMMERDTGRSKGFGFVEMGSDEEAQSAINGMNGQPLGGRSVVVNEARPMEERPNDRSRGQKFVSFCRRGRHHHLPPDFFDALADGLLATLAPRLDLGRRTAAGDVWRHAGHHELAVLQRDQNSALWLGHRH